MATAIQRVPFRCGLSLLAVLLAPGLSATEEVQRGGLLLIGGALRADNAEVYHKFIALAGGKDRARIGVFPTANSSDLPARRVVDCLREQGIGGDRALVIDITPGNALEQARNPDVVEQIRGCTGLFIAGGDQRLVSRALLGEDGRGTPALDAIRDVYRRGGVVAGTSAGAAVQGATMISAPDDAAPIDTLDFGLAARPHHRGALLSRGLALFGYGLVDQHFNTSDGRLARLARALVETRTTLGFGIDEDTAMLAGTDGRLDVLGRGGVTIVDASRAGLADGPLGVRLTGLRVHYLERGDAFDVPRRALRVHPSKARIAAGDEHFTSRRAPADLSQTDAVRRTLIAGLIDHAAESRTGVLLRCDGEEGHGYLFTFTETSETRGYCGPVDGRRSYAAFGVQLEVRPITVTLGPASDASPSDLARCSAPAEVQAIVFRGLLATDRDRRFHPGQTLTRAEFARALARATGVARQPGPRPFVRDVSAATPEVDDILSAVAEGLMELDHGAFRPSEPVSRRDVAAALGRALVLGTPLSAIDLPRGAGDTDRTGLDCCRIVPGSIPARPLDPATRDEVASALFRFLDLSR